MFSFFSFSFFPYSCRACSFILFYFITCFFLQDVIDLRRNKWVSRRKVAGPKTIEEIHKEAKLEASIIELADATAQMGPPPSSRRSEDRRRSRLEAKASTTTTGDEGWSNVPSRAAKMMPEKLDSSRLRLSKVDTDQLQLGPPGQKFSTWGRGSSAATPRKSSQAAEQQQSAVRSTNRFQSLDDSDMVVAPSSGLGAAGSNYFGRASEPVRRSAERSASRGSSQSGRSSSRNHSAEARKRSPRPSSITTGGGGGKLNGASEADPDFVKSKFGPILEEYLSNCDYSEACRSICELFSCDNIGTLVDMACSDVLDRSLRDQRKAGELLSCLMRDGLLSVHQVAEGLAPILEIASDILVDIPKLWEYLGEILAPLLTESSAVDAFLSTCYLSLTDEPELRARLTVAVLAAVNRARPEALARILAQTGDSLDSHLSGGGGLVALLAANGVKPADPVTNGG